MQILKASVVVVLVLCVASVSSAGQVSIVSGAASPGPDGHVVNDIVVTSADNVGGQQLVVNLTAGTINQSDFGSDLPPNAALFTAFPNLPNDTFVGGMAPDSAALMSTTNIDITWAPGGGVNVLGTNTLARVTLSNDAAGSWRLVSTERGAADVDIPLSDGLIGGGVMSIVPEPATIALSLMCLVGLVGFTRRR